MFSLAVLEDMGVGAFSSLRAGATIMKGIAVLVLGGRGRGHERAAVMFLT